MPNDNKVKKEKKHFFKNFKAELKKVIWPTPKQLVNNTVAVITIVLITTIIVFALDFIFENINTNGVNKLKELTGGYTNSTELVNEENTNVETTGEQQSTSTEETTNVETQTNE